MAEPSNRQQNSKGHYIKLHKRSNIKYKKEKELRGLFSPTVSFQRKRNWGLGKESHKTLDNSHLSVTFPPSMPWGLQVKTLLSGWLVPKDSQLFGKVGKNKPPKYTYTLLTFYFNLTYRCTFILQSSIQGQCAPLDRWTHRLENFFLEQHIIIGII